MKYEFAREKELLNLLNLLRTKMGFFITNDQENRIISIQPLHAQKYVDEVFEAENMNPQHNLNLSRQVKRMFTDRFGNLI